MQGEEKSELVKALDAIEGHFAEKKARKAEGIEKQIEIKAQKLQKRAAEIDKKADEIDKKADEIDKRIDAINAAIEELTRRVFAGKA